MQGRPVERWLQVQYVWTLQDGEEPSRLPAMLGAAAAKGKPEAQYALYVVLSDAPENRAPDKQAALEGLLRHAARSGHCLAKYALGFNYENGIGIAADLAQARDWYRQSAACGNPVAGDALQHLP